LFAWGANSKSLGMKRFVPFLKSDPVVSVVRMSGVIAGGSRGALSDQALAPVLERAFTKGKPQAVALQINSPGGSPVQSSLIGARIRRLSEDKKVPVFAFVEDVAASGGYWIASAADEIWADVASVVGSIGVISAGFGAHEFLARQGIERRVYTAGNSKSMLDPFRPEKPEDVERLKVILEEMHTIFISHIKDRRGPKLTEDVDVFTGEIWLAEKAAELGLIDGVSHIAPKMKERFGDKVKFRRYDMRRPLLRRFGAQMMDDVVTTLDERAAFARFGL